MTVTNDWRTFMYIRNSCLLFYSYISLKIDEDPKYVNDLSIWSIKLKKEDSHRERSFASHARRRICFQTSVNHPVAAAMGDRTPWFLGEEEE